MPLTVPPLNEDLSLRYYTPEEFEQIDLKRIGVSGEGTHVRDELGPDGSGSTREFSCAWEERYAAALVLVGFAKSYTDEDGKLRISRLLPDVHPAGGGITFQWVCTKVAIDPFAYTGEIDAVEVGQSMPRFKRAKLTATYELVPHQLFEDTALTAATEFHRYVAEFGSPGADMQVTTSYIQQPGGIQAFTTPGGASRPAGLPVPYAIGWPETETKKALVWHRIPRDLYGKGTTLYERIKGDGVTRGYIGAVNLTEFLGHPPLTLKLEGVEERLLPDPFGADYAWQLVFRFSEKAVPYGHLGLYFFETATTGFVADSGYYQVLNRGNTATLSAAAIAAAEATGEISMFPVREFANLLIVGTV